jgi:hypothetical protein
MPVEIKELVIRAIVNEGKNTVENNSAAIGNVERKILKVVNKLFKQNKKNDR